MGDLLKPAAEWMSHNIPLVVAIGLFIFCIFFEISKIKIYPLKWLWKAISWPFRKVDEQRTQSFKNIVKSLKTDMDTKFEDITNTVDSKIDALSTNVDNKIDEMSTSFNESLDKINTTFDQKLNEVSTSQTSNCSAVKECFADLKQSFEALAEQQLTTEERLDMLAAARIKNHVLNFARQCRKGEKHSHEDFANLMRENLTYLELVKKYGWQNDVYTHDFAYIKKVYDKCNENGSFLE